MDIESPQALLGGLSPARFMRRHWQKRPLLVRQAWPGVRAPLPRAELLALAAAEGVESRLVVRGGAGWTLRQGPMPRRALPPVRQPGWTLLVQGLDLHVRAARAMLDRFRFVPEARLDDLMLSYATDQGGVGPHLDSYDVFLLQVHGRRRWRIAPPGDDALVEGLPLKILRRFEPQQEWVLEPGDLLYLPPRWGHDGVAEGECMTCSVGFRAPAGPALAGELLARLADADSAAEADAPPALYRDPTQPATGQPGRIPPALQAFSRRAVERALGTRDALELALGESLTEPKAHVWFEPGPAAALQPDRSVVLDARSRMMYDDRHVYINGESFRAGGLDGRLMRELADRRALKADALRRLSAQALALVHDWLESGWLLAGSPDETPSP
jgi:50S ribosomal protein L16 3-hydroxylase